MALSIMDGPIKFEKVCGKSVVMLPGGGILNYGDFSGSMTLDDVGVIGLDFTFYLNPAHRTVSLDTILEKNNNDVVKFKILSPSV